MVIDAKSTASNRPRSREQLSPNQLSTPNVLFSVSLLKYLVAVGYYQVYQSTESTLLVSLN
ncbi:hypothetical protein HYPBUDRAFT_153474 [Hyphopichia burtonii NRRL Y-1933]|uniref:Uncharacterized protein n=1 Tax=Hyphopichia burtonii NRRL Y-1933 TaxID=984485 RepID=A0A1E4RF21_9ASCO|nr:hypothetical protein HYPBUDRAFT_153474 [Hyphopichia burtonii NRRL Y-1933]ODV65843.1 hypothetical protein HYPBUDRAFT_153474 [Hyphopichia burtonii NRRL Y-1933]